MRPRDPRPDGDRARQQYNRRVTAKSPQRFLIVGGGPAGCAAAITLAHHGKDVVLVEKSNYQAPRIGELLSPQGQQVIQRLLPQHYSSLYLTQIGIVALWEDNSLARFSGRDWWTIDRNALDQALFETARAAGAQTIMDARISDLRRNKEGWEYEVQGTTHFAHHVIDATGRASRVARFLGAEVQRYDHQIALVAFLEGDCQAPPDMLLETTPEGWWYTAPIDSSRAVTAFMTDSDLDKGDATVNWQRHFQASVEVSRRFGNLQVIGKPVRVNAGFSLLLPSYGEGWTAVGEAATCFDPLTNFGIGRAAEMGESLAFEFLSAEEEGRPPSLLSHSEDLGLEFQIHFRKLLSSYRRVRRFPGSVFWARRSGPVTDNNLLRVRKSQPASRRLLFPNSLNFECTQCGLCCGPDRLVHVPQNARPDFMSLRVLPDESLSTADKDNGDCLYLGHDQPLCSLHGSAHKPLACRQFPFTLRDTPEGIVVGLSYLCPSVQSNTGRPLKSYRSELEKLVGEKQPHVLPRLIAVSWGRGFPWEEYRELEDYLLAGESVPKRIPDALWALSLWLQDSSLTKPEYRPGSSDFPSPLQSVATCILASQMEHEGEEQQLEFQSGLLHGEDVEFPSSDLQCSLPQLLAERQDEVLARSEEYLDRFVRTLLHRKFLLGQGPVYHNLAILNSLQQLLAIYSALAWAASKADKLAEVHMESALGKLERLLTGPGRHRIQTGALFRAYMSNAPVSMTK